MIDEIKTWINEFVSVHNDSIGHIPCPFAKQAMVDEKIKYVAGFDTLDDLVLNWSDDVEVVVFYAPTEQYQLHELTYIVDEFNKQAMSKDIVALEDHPHDPELLNGATMNFGKAILILVQRLSKLNLASKILHKKGYYDNWPKENYDSVVKWRQHES